MSDSDETIRWAGYDEDVLLYSPEAAAWGKRLLEVADRIETWGDFRTARAEEAPGLVEPIAELLWERWDGGWYEEFDVVDDEVGEDRFAAVTDIDSLAAVFSDEDTCPVETIRDGEPVLADPFDAYAMGVPAEIIAEFYVEHANMVSSWTVCPVEMLPAVAKRLGSLGLRFEEGDTGDLPHM